MKQVEVNILGQGYLLACPEGSEARLEAAVATVDREMTAIRDAGRIKARERIAVLAALNIAFQLADRMQADARLLRNAAPPSPAPSLAPNSGRLPAEATGADWQALIARIDAALSSDGHLI